MADFCSFCYYNDVDYNSLVNKNINAILDGVREGGSYLLSGYPCEGCGSNGIVIKEDFSVFIDYRTLYGQSPQFIGKLKSINKKDLLIETNKHYGTYKIEIDESSEIFKKTYKKKKERSNLELKTILREFEAVKHIAYALYMIGDKPGIVSHHDCISFEEFDVKNYNSISDKAWKLYIESNMRQDRL